MVPFASTTAMRAQAAPTTNKIEVRMTTRSIDLGCLPPLTKSKCLEWLSSRYVCKRMAALLLRRVIQSVFGKIVPPELRAFGVETVARCWAAWRSCLNPLPAVTCRVSANFALANFLASTSLRNVLVALGCGRFPRGSSNETYHVSWDLLAMTPSRGLRRRLTAGRRRLRASVVVAAGESGRGHPTMIPLNRMQVKRGESE
jgi:hypothetical protein